METKKVKIYKRVLAFLIDFIIVGIFSALIIYLLPYNEKYQETIKQNEVLQELVLSKQIDNQDYVSNSVKITYNSYKYGLLENGISVGIMILYFTLFTYFNHGKTIGKMIMRYQVSSKDGNDPSFVGSLVRSLLLTRAFGDIITIILVLSLSEAKFVSIYNYFDMGITIVWLTCPFISMFREDGRGLHDLVAKTIVLDKRKQDSTEIVEAKYEEKVEVEEVKTKKNNKKK